MKKLMFITACIFAFLYFFLAKLSDNKHSTISAPAVEEIAEEDTIVNDNHLTFKGVPIDGTLARFVKRMKKAGFSYDDEDSGTAILSGDFAGYKGCTVLVSTLDRKDLVSYITVRFPSQDTWGGISGNYYAIKKLLTQKYGKPSACTEKFQGYYIDDDNSKMHAVEFDQCKYSSTFTTDKGTIKLVISHADYNDCFVALRYSDKINSGIITNEALKDL